MKEKGFDTSKYIKAEVEEIRRRSKMFHGRLYLEIGGKFYKDTHASRVLPGYKLDTKVRIIKKLRKEVDVVHCISAKMVKMHKMTGDSHVLYINLLMRNIKELQNRGLETDAVFVSRLKPSTKNIVSSIKKKLTKELGKGNKISVLRGYEIPGYPNDLKTIVSKKGYGRQDYIEIENPFVVITAPGPGSGKMAFALSQMYRDRQNGIKSGFTKIETFPVWNLPLNHPVNIAYEAATADIGDYNVIDRYHLRAYKKKAVNYNRDVDNYEILERIITAMTDNEDPLRKYKSPTDMGIGFTKKGIENDKVVRKAAEREIIRRYFRYLADYNAGREALTTVKRMERLLKKARLDISA
ncbi:MAG: DUF1846 family protein [Kosmotogaceae bacterium]|nr:DUF1846 family protein [Kosmotogaceae bacterium]